MDFRSLLADIPSGAGRELLIEKVITSEALFTELLTLAIREKDPLAWRASWVLDGCDERKHGLATRHIPAIVRSLPGLESKGSLRSLLRMLSRHDIPEDEQGLLIDLCFSYLVSELYPLAVKAHAMLIIFNHVLIYPELKDEFITVLDDHSGNNSVGFRTRARMLKKQLEKL